jgi:hypothetical protein
MPWPDFGDLALSILDRLARIETMLSANSERLDRMDKRFDRIEDRMQRPRPKISDLLPWAYGILILISAAAGKLTIVEALALLKSAG